MNTPKNLLIANPDQSIVLTPAEVIRRMFAYTDENGILIVPNGLAMIAWSRATISVA